MTRTAWIVEEIPPIEGSNKPIGVIPNPESWVGKPIIEALDDYDTALQFARKVDAERFRLWLAEYNWGSCSIQVVEHQFDLTQEEMEI